MLTRPLPMASSATEAHSIALKIFHHDDKQKQAANKSLNALKISKPFKDPIVVDVTEASTFYPAEGYHQDYYLKNAIRYKFYRYSCGRDARLEELWGDS